MAEMIYRLIPSSPDTLLPRDTVKAAVEYLKNALHTTDVIYVIAESPIFVDCGTELHQLRCPVCREPLSLRWWAECMGHAAESDFRERSVLFPCCLKRGALEEIEYIEPCGLASVILEIRNTAILPDSEMLNTLRCILGCDLRIIRAVY